MTTRLGWLGFVAGVLLLARSPLGLWLGNRLRAWSDSLMIGFLRLTSDFEREAEPAPAEA